MGYRFSIFSFIYNMAYFLPNASQGGIVGFLRKIRKCDEREIYEGILSIINLGKLNKNEE